MKERESSKKQNIPRTETSENSSYWGEKMKKKEEERIAHGRKDEE